MHLICGLYVKLTPKHSLLKSRAEKYLVNDCKNIVPDIDLDDFDNELVRVEYDENTPPSMLEYTQKGALLFQKMIDFDSFVLHSCAVEYKGDAYLFSGESGAGKSTHGKMWLERFGSEVKYINEDKPLIKKINGSFFACGNPFSGKFDNNTNSIVPIKGVCIIEKSDKNEIEPVEKKKAFSFLLSQTLTFLDAQKMSKLLDLLDCFVQNVNVYRLRCTVSPNAAETAFIGMSSDKYTK